VPGYAEQVQRFLRRPGAETVVSSLELETQRAAGPLARQGSSRLIASPCTSLAQAG